MLGQVFLAFAFGLLALRVLAWAWPGAGLGAAFDLLFEGRLANLGLVNPLSYKWFVDVLFGGVIGVGFYFKCSGRVWCRFACPLAALMHVYARFSRFAIVPEKKKCISCNVCTSVCHQGIDVMSFANRGLPMVDPECVRCSACVESCPTGVLQFGAVDRAGGLIALDTLAASPVLMREGA
jgi:polyferredoxin